MRQKDLPQRWQDSLRNYLKESGSKYDSPGADAFHHNLRITFADKSHAFFYYAFYLIDENSNEIAVFTEHCGYHIFFLIDTKLETIDRHGNILKTEDFSID